VSVTGAPRQQARAHAAVSRDRLKRLPAALVAAENGGNDGGCKGPGGSKGAGCQSDVRARPTRRTCARRRTQARRHSPGGKERSAAGGRRPAAPKAAGPAGQEAVLRRRLGTIRPRRVASAANTCACAQPRQRSLPGMPRGPPAPPDPLRASSGRSIAGARRPRPAPGRANSHCWSPEPQQNEGPHT